MGIATSEHYRRWLPLAVVLAVAAALRVPGLDAGLWYDEVVTLVEFVRLPAADLLTTYTTPNNHILYSLAARASVTAFGETAWALRLPAALLGVAGIAAVWLLGARLIDRREATMAAGLLAVSYHHVWFSQNARGYTGLLLGTVLATWLFVAGMRRPGRGPWLGYAAVAALTLYTHLSAAFVFAAHGAVLAGVRLLRRARPRRRERYPGSAGAWPLLGLGLAVALTVLLYAPLIPQMVETFGTAAAEPDESKRVREWTNPLWTAVEIARGLGGSWPSVAALLVVGVLAAVGLVSLARRDAVLAAAVVLPAPLMLVVLVAISYHVWPRYFFALLGFAALVLVRGLFAVAGPRRGQALALVLIAASALTLPRNYRFPKQDFAGARDHVEARRVPGDAVLTVGLASLPYERYYAPTWRTIHGADDLDRALREHRRVWLVYYSPVYLAHHHADVQQRLARDFEEVRQFPGTLSGGTIHVCRSR